MAWKDTSPGLRILFWIALVVGLAMIAFFVYMLWFTANFKPV